jgi:hypothetical protein
VCHVSARRCYRWPELTTPLDMEKPQYLYTACSLRLTILQD